MTDICPFCEILAFRAPAHHVRMWEDAIAIVPLKPVTLGHVLVIPRQHVPDFGSDPEVTALTARRAAELGKELDLEAVNLITSKGKAATQSVFHLHMHLVPRSVNDGLALPWYGGRKK